MSVNDKGPPPRQRALDELIRAQRLDALVTCSYESLCYFALTDIQSQVLLPDRLALFIAVRDAPPSLLVCNIEESQVRSQTPIEDIRCYVEFADDPGVSLAELLRSRGIVSGRVGIEGRRFPAVAVRTLERELRTIDFVAIDSSLEAAQMMKDERQIAVLTHGARALLRALDGAIESLLAGSTEMEYASEILVQIARAGGMPIFLVFAAGQRTTLGHPDPHHRAMEPGSIWRTDFGARFTGGLKADVARTGVVGEASMEQREIFAHIRAIQDAIVAMIEPDRPARELYETALREFARANLPFTMPHVGHGIGVGLHEPPLLEPANATPLKPGMVLNVEPLTVLENRGEGYHTEDLVVVTDGGHQWLTEPQQELLLIPAEQG